MRSALVRRELGYICRYALYHYQVPASQDVHPPFRQIQPRWQPGPAMSVSENPR